MSPILNISNATKTYTTPEGDVVTALDNVSLKVMENEFVTLLGPSGCGKTTLLRAISGFEDLQNGAIEIDGKNVTHLPAHKRPVNTVFQKYALFPHMSIAQNVAYSLEVAGTPKKQIKDRVIEILALVGLEGFGSRKIQQLSGGQQQRVALARSLVAQPKILLLDEPLSALDKNLRHRMQQELKQLQADIGITFIFVTHDQEEALTMSDRIVVLSGGKIQQLGTPEELYHRPENEFVARFLGEGNLLDGEVVQQQGDKITLKLADGQTSTLHHSNHVAGKQVKMLARPEDVIIGKSGSDQDLHFSCVIEQIFFVGTDYQIIASNAEGTVFKLTLRQSAQQQVEIPSEGEKIDLTIPTEALHVISDMEAPS